MVHLRLRPEANAKIRCDLLLSFGLTAGGLLLHVLLLAINLPVSGTGVWSSFR